MDDEGWLYVDPNGNTQGPFPLTKLKKWAKHFPSGQEVWQEGSTGRVALSAVIEEAGKGPGEQNECWSYVDPQGVLRGPFSLSSLRRWEKHLPATHQISRPGRRPVPFKELLATFPPPGGVAPSPRVVAVRGALQTALVPFQAMLGTKLAGVQQAAEGTALERIGREGSAELTPKEVTEVNAVANMCVAQALQG